MRACFTAMNKKIVHADVTVSMLAYGNFTAWNLFFSSTAKLEKHSDRGRQKASPAATNKQNSVTLSNKGTLVMQ